MPDSPANADPSPARWDVNAEAVAVRIRWFGLVVGYLYANAVTLADPFPLNVLLGLGFVFTVLDTYHSWHGRVFLGGSPLIVSSLEALFIGLLCYLDGGPESPFRHYSILSVLCAAIRYSPLVTGWTCAVNCVGYAVLYASVPTYGAGVTTLLFTLIVLVWVAWAAVALVRLLRRVGDELAAVNAGLEERIAERTRQLQESQAQVLHQEKMAAFGLLAAGIAHEVGNPLTAVSTIVQMLERRDLDDHTRERLGLVTAQLTRIQTTLRELVTFSRPASDSRGRVALRGIVDEALGIAKYYKGVKNREVRSDVPADLPPLDGVRDQLVQVFFNLVLNAIDATGKGGRVLIAAAHDAGKLVVTVSDDGHGIDPAHRERLFRPYFTTKKHGTGLGLFVTRKLVDAHGGTVECDSRPGEGTTFRLVFPAAEEWSAGNEVPETPRTPTAAWTPPGVATPGGVGRWEIKMTTPRSAVASVLVVDDEPVIRANVAEYLHQEGFAVHSAASGEAALGLVGRNRYDVILCDVNLPGIDGIEVLERVARVSPETFVLIFTAYATVESAVDAFHKGAHDYLMKPIILREVDRKIRRLLAQRDLHRENQWLRRELHREADASDMVVGRTPAVRLVVAMARKAAPTGATVLITGESGTGKELLARDIHRTAQAAKPTDGRFVAVNCAAIPSDRLEAHLFGQRAAAFSTTDADAPGVFAAAGAGTVFLDEVGELPPATQAKLLRAIEQKEVTPVGAAEPVRVEARIVAATNKDLPAEVTAGRFREDLFYRLNVVVLHLPPLRDRREDIPELVEHLLAKHAGAMGKKVAGVSREAMPLLQAAAWKGNVRELENALQRAVILGEGPLVTPADLPPDLAPAADDPSAAEPLDEAVRRFEKRHIERLLRLSPDKKEAARRLDIGLSSLYRKIEQYGIGAE